MTVSRTRTTAAAVQFSLVSNPAIALNSTQSSTLQLALAGATNRITTLLGRTDRTSVLSGIYGTAGTNSTTFNSNLTNLFSLLSGSGFKLQVEVRSANEMNGAAAAYAPVGPDGVAKVYLNADLLSNGTTSEQIAWLLLEQFGQAVDRYLNGNLDATGDEGKLFAQALTGRSLTTAEQATLGRDAAGGVVTINGTAVAVESEANAGPTLSATATGASFREASGLGSQAAAVSVFSNTTVSVGGATEAWQAITGFGLSVGGLRDGSNEILWVDGTAINLGAAGSGSTSANGLTWSVSVSGDIATLSFSKAGGLSSAAMAALINAVSYQNTNADNPTAGNRTITITSLSDSGGAVGGGSGTSTPNITSTISVIAVNDAPQLGSLADINLQDTSAADTFSASIGTLSASDPEGSALTYGLDGAFTSSTTFDGISYNLSRAGSFGTLYLNSSSGQYRFQPKSDWQLNALSSSGTDSFSLSVSDGSLSTSTTLLVNFTGTQDTPEQYVLIDDGAPVLTTDAQALWEQSLTLASRYLSELLSDPDRDSIFNDVFGRAGTDPDTFQANLQTLLATLASTGLQIDVDLRSDEELNGALAAYSAVGHTGKERIYVNGDKLNSGALDLVTTVSALLEEFAHGMDVRLNGGADSPGDEGQLFASEVTGVTLTADQRALIDAENDSATLTIEGVQVLVEEAVTVNNSPTYTEGGTASDLFISNSQSSDFQNGSDCIRYSLTNIIQGDRLSLGTSATSISTTISLDANSNGSFLFQSQTLTYSVSVSSGTATVTIAGFNTVFTGNSRRNNKSLMANNTFFSTTNENPSGNKTITIFDQSTTNPNTFNQLATGTLTVSGVNDAPVNTVPASTQSVAEDTALVFSSANGNLISISDVDAGSSIVQVQLTVTNGTIALSGTTGLTLQAGANNSSTMTYRGTVANLNSALAGLTYSPTANYNGSAQLTIVTSDLGNTGSGGTLTDTDTVNITVNAVNDAPVTGAGGNTLTYTENGAAAAINGSLTLTDADNSTLSSATVSISSGFVAAEDILAFSNTNPTTFGNIGASYNSSTGVLTLTSAGSTATVAQFQAALRAVTYVNGSDNPSTTSRTVSFRANDGAASGNITTSTITVAAVNDAPVTGAGGNTLAYAENGAAAAINSSLTLTDADNSTLSSATVSITAGFVAAEDTLAFTNTNSTTFGNINASYNSSTGVLTLTSAGSTATVAQFQAALRAVTYVNGSDNPSTTSRTVSFRASDGAASGNITTSTITVAAVNDAPVTGAGGNTLAYTENGAAAAINSSLTLTDADNSTLSSATVSITAGFVAAEDTLAFTNTNSTTFGNINASYNSSTGVLTLTSAGSTATVAQFQAALRAVTYVNGSDNPSTTSRTVSFRANDGAASGNITTSTITVAAVNDAPVNSSVNLSVQEGQTVTLSAANFSLSDPDSSSFTYTLSGIFGGYFQLSSAPGNAITSFATAQLNTGSVQFVDNGDETAPSFSVTVNDGSADSSTVAAAITYTPLNDAPSLSSVNLSVQEGQTVTLSAANFSLSDPDSSSFTYTLSGIFGGYFQLSSAPGNAITSFATAQLNTGSVQFVDNGDETAPSFSVTVNDGSANSSTLAASISYTPVNDAPTLNANAASVQGDFVREVGFDIANPRTAVTFMQPGQINLADVDSNSFSQITVRIRTSWLQNGASEKLLIKDGSSTLATIDLAPASGSYAGSASFTLSGVSYTATLGELTVSGNAYRSITLTKASGLLSTAEAEAVLDALYYTNTDSSVQTSARRTFELFVTDAGGATSNATDVVVTLGNGPRIDLDGNGSGYNGDANYRLVSFTEGDLPGVKLASDGAAAGGINLQQLYNEASYTLVGDAIPGLSFNSNGTWSYNTASSGLSLAVGASQTFTINYNWTDSADNTKSGQHFFTITVTNQAGSLVATSNRPLSGSAGASISGQLAPSVDRLGVGINKPLFVDGGHEFFVINGATDHIANGQAVASGQEGRLNLLSNPSSALGSMNGSYGSFTLGGVSYRYEFVAITDSLNRIFFTKNTGSGSGGTLTYAEAEALIDAYHYLNTSDAPTTSTNRTLNFGVFSEGLGNAPATATIQLVNVDDEATGTLSVTGTAVEGGSLEASLTDVLDADGTTTTAYRWQEQVSGTWTDISGAITTTLTIPSDQSYVGKSVRIVATTTDLAGGTTVFEGSSQTIANVNDAPGGGVSITGTPTQGQILTASISLVDADGLGTITYQWNANGEIIADASGATYTLSQADVGKSISVTASYTDGFGTAESVTSSGTTGVANINDLPTGSVTISGTATEGQTLTASNNLGDLDGLGTITYQWEADGVAIENASGSSFTLTQAQVGKAITVTASYTDVLGASEAVTSEATALVANVDTTAPVFSSGSSAAVNENVAANTVVYQAASTDSDFNAPATADSITYSLTGTDAAAFAIDASGAVTIKSSPDFESKSSYAFDVVATDAAGNSSLKAVSLTINNLDEVAPTITSGSSATAINENSGAGQVIYTATATDTLDITNGVTFALKPDTGDVSAFSINASSGAVTLSGNPDFETKPSYAFTVVATDAAGNSSEQAVSLAINNRDEVAPSITSGATAAAINENSGAGQTIYTATATDSADISAGVSFSLKPNSGDGSAFSIDSSSGAVTLSGNPDFETRSSYAFTVVATDAAGNSSEQLVTLAINDLDEIAPLVSITSVGGSDATVSSVANDNRVVGTAEANRTVSIFLGQTLLGSTSADASGNFSYSFSADDLTAIGQGSGKVVTASQTDAAGNTGSSSGFNFSVDTLAPTAPSLALGSGVSTGATALEATQATGVVTVSAASGSSLQVSFNRGVNTVTKTLTATGASQAVALSSGDLASLGNGSISVSAVAIDPAGNSSSAATTSFNLDTGAPTLTSLSFGSNDGNLAIGESLTLVATLSEVVNVTGNPTLVLNNGGSATYVSGSGSNQLTFTYTPLTGQSTNALTTAASTAIRGTITDQAGNSVVASSFNNITASNGPVAVDVIAPTLTTISYGSNDGALALGESIDLVVTGSEALKVGDVPPTLALNTGGSASYISGSGTNQLLFRYTPGAGQSTADLATASNALSGAITDLAGNAITTNSFNSINPTGTVMVDTTAPTVSAVAISSATGAQNSQLNAGDIVAVTVTMSEAVIVDTTGGTPQLSLNVGGTTRIAKYSSGSGSSALVFTYTVQASDSDPNGISIDADGISLNGGSLRDLAGNTTTSLSHNAVSDNGSYVVNNTLPQVTAISYGTNDGNLAVGEAISLLVDFDETVQVTGTPSLLLNSGGSALYSGGSGTSQLTFTYTPDAGQSTPDLGTASSKALSNALNGSITDLAGNAVVATSFDSKDPSGTVVVDAIAAQIASLSVSSSTGTTLGTGSIISVTVTMNESVSVSGTPSLTVNLGGEINRMATYVAADSTSTSLVFRYTIDAADSGASAISIPANSLTNVSGSTIRDAAGNNVLLSHQAYADGSYVVDATAPTLTDLAISSATGSQNSSLNAGDVVFISATMSETVNVTGTPQLLLNVGGSSRTASYRSGSGNNTLLFSYTIEAGDSDSNGIAIDVNSLVLNEGTIKDIAGNNAVLTSVAIADNASYKVDTTAPTITNLAISSATGIQNNSLNVGDVVTLGVSLSEAVTVSGNPLLNLRVGNSTRSAVYVGGSGTTELQFAYTIQAGDNDSNGISFEAGTLLLNGGAIVDAAGNAANLSTSAISDNAAYRVDTAAPVASFSSTIGTDSGLTGTINSGGASRDNTLALSGTASDAGVLSKVEIYDGATYLGDATLDSNAGTWSYSTPSNPALSDGNHSFTARVMDQAGNVFITSAVNARIDTSAPGRPSITFAIDDVVPGTANVLNGGTTNDNTPTLRVSLQGSGAVAGDSVELLSGATVVTSATITSTNINDGFVQLTPTLINDGTYTFTTRLVDTVGNVSQTSAAFSIIIDRAAPAPLSLALASDTGISTGDGITQTGTINITGLETPTTSWQYSINGGRNWFRGSGNSFTLPNGSYGVGTVQVRQADLAGNLSAIASNGNPITVDNTAPTIAISSSKPSLGLVGGNPDSSTITFVLSEAASFSLSAITVSSSLVEGINTPDGTLSNLQGSGTLYTATFTPRADLNGTATLSIDSGVLTDLAGNSNSDGADANNRVSISVNTVTPAASSLPAVSAINIDAASDSGTLGDWITNNTNTSFSGTLSQALSAGQTLQLSKDGSTWVTVSSIGTGFSFNASTLGGLSSSTTLQARVFNSDSNSYGNTWSRFLTIDTSTYTGSLTLLNYSGTSSNGSAAGTDNTFQLSLPNAEPGATISYKRWNGASWDTVSADQSNLADGTYRYRAVATDVAGNEATSGELSLAIDRTAPTAPTLALNNVVSDPVSRSQLTASNGAILVTTSEAGATVTLTISSDALGSSPVVKTFTSSGGTQSVVFTSTDASVLGDGTLTANVTISDPAGNSSSGTPLNFNYVAQPVTILGDLSISRSQNGSETGPKPSIFTLTRTGDLSSAFTANYRLTGTAVSGTGSTGDYIMPTLDANGLGSVTFLAGANTATLSIATIDNSILNTTPRTITATLIKPDTYNLISTASTSTITLEDNETGAVVPEISINNISFSEGNGSDWLASIDVNLSQATSIPVTASFSFRDGTASGNGIDYSGSGGTITFAAGSTRQQVSFTVKADTSIENDEDFYIDLSNPTNATLKTNGSSAKVTITNDDSDIGIFASPKTLADPGILNGADLNDSLTGSSGADTISGGGGDDTLTGMLGADQLSGGTGSDVFKFISFSHSTATSFDTISDFSIVQGDRIAISSIPSKFWSLGTISATSLSAALASAYADADRSTSGSRPLASGEAMSFRWGTSISNRIAYLVVDNPNSNSSADDLVIRVGGLSFSTVGEIAASDVFTTT